MLHRHCFLGQTHFRKLVGELCFLKKCRVVILIYMIIYKKRIRFNIALVADPRIARNNFFRVIS